MKRDHEGDTKPVDANKDEPKTKNQNPKEEKMENAEEEEVVTLATIDDLMDRCRTAQQQLTEGCAGISQQFTDNDMKDEEEEEEFFVKYPGQTAADILCDMNDLMAKCQLIEKTARELLFEDSSNNNNHDQNNSFRSSDSKLVETPPKRQQQTQGESP